MVLSRFSDLERDHACHERVEYEQLSASVAIATMQLLANYLH